MFYFVSCSAKEAPAADAEDHAGHCCVAWPDGHARSLLAEGLYNNIGLRSLSDLKAVFLGLPRIPLIFLLGRNG